MSDHIYSETKPSLDDLEHFGVKGQKWGVRRGAGVTGISRTRGSAIDRNDRFIKAVGQQQRGEKYKVNAAIGKALYGKENFANIRKTQVKNVAAQNERILAGKINVADRVNIYANTYVHPLDNVISRRPT